MSLSLNQIETLAKKYQRGDETTQEMLTFLEDVYDFVEAYIVLDAEVNKLIETASKLDGLVVKLKGDLEISNMNCNIWKAQAQEYQKISGEAAALFERAKK